MTVTGDADFAEAFGLAGKTFSRVETRRQTEACVCSGWYCNGGEERAGELWVNLLLLLATWAITACIG